MPIKDMKPRGKGIEGRLMGLELAGDFQAGRSKADGLFTVRVDYGDQPNLAYRNKVEAFKYDKGEWKNTTLLRIDGEEDPILIPRYRTVPAWLVAELDAVRKAWEEANPDGAKRK